MPFLLLPVSPWVIFYRLLQRTLGLTFRSHAAGYFHPPLSIEIKLLLISLTIRVRGASSAKRKEEANKATCCLSVPSSEMVAVDLRGGRVKEMACALLYYEASCHGQQRSRPLRESPHDAHLRALPISEPPVPPEPSAAWAAAQRGTSDLW